MPAQHHSCGGGGDGLPQSVHEIIHDQPLAKPVDRKLSRNREGFLFDAISYDEILSFDSTQEIGEQRTPGLQPREFTSVLLLNNS